MLLAASFFIKGQPQIIASLFANVLALAAPLFVIQVLNRYVAHGIDATLATLTSGVLIAIILEYAFRKIRICLGQTVSAKPDTKNAITGFNVLLKVKASALKQIPGKTESYHNLAKTSYRFYSSHKDIINGEKFSKFREIIKTNHTVSACNRCGYIESKSYNTF